MCHDFAVMYAVERVAAPDVMLCSAFAGGRVCDVEDRNS